MTQAPRIVYLARDDATPQTELSALATVYRLVLNSANKNAAGVTSTNGDDAKERSQDDSSATRNYTR
jgi:hypothetical protein